jgi:hypothetical protein
MACLGACFRLAGAEGELVARCNMCYSAADTFSLLCCSAATCAAALRLLFRYFVAALSTRML